MPICQFNIIIITLYQFGKKKQKKIPKISFLQKHNINGIFSKNQKNSKQKSLFIQLLHQTSSEINILATSRLLCNKLLCLGNSFINPSRILAAGLGHIWTAAATTANLRRCCLYEVACLDAALNSFFA